MNRYGDNIHRNSRQLSRKARERDIPVTVMAAQLFVVLLLLLALWLSGKVSPEAKARLQASLQAETSAYLGGSAGNWRELFYSGAGKGTRALSRAKPTEAKQYEIELPEYNYLEPDALGRGGLNLVELSAKKDEPPLPPKNAVLSPFFLSIRPLLPVSGVISSGFGWREHPISKTLDFHTGLDIAAPEGQIIFAALPGLVKEVGYSNIYGNYLIIEHGNGVETSYSHCSEILAAEGMVLRQGERIAKVGQTGIATGPHLHFSVLADGNYLNPFWVLQDYFGEGV